MNNFKISISSPPLTSNKGVPFLSQNRQFQWTNTGNVIYPIVPAYAATLLKAKGFEVFWDDAVAQKLTYESWLNRIIKYQPDLIAIESKTPVIKTHWQIINDLKARSSKTKNWIPIIVLMGDHVTALPEESLKNSEVDYILTGGDYDFMLLSLAIHLTTGSSLEPGFWYRTNKPAHQRTKALTNSGPFALKHHHLDSLPFLDRDLTQWQLYSRDNTNYKYLPGTYTMFGRDCWWGKCTFCSWTTLHPSGTFRSFSPTRALDEIGHIINNYPVREIFDDTGTFPVGKWLFDFCQGLIDRGYHRRVTIGCNMRFGALTQAQYELMAKANFRFILYGLESSNDTTLKRIEKMTIPSDARASLSLAKRAGLEPHLTIMIGYPWETLKDAQTTLSEARQLFKDGLADSMQATRIIPYPGTPLFRQCLENNWLLTQNWEDYDMRQPIISSPISHTQQEALIQSLFKGILTPKFLIKKVLSIRNLGDIQFLMRYALKYLKKLKDFSKSNVQ
ncbi:MAG: radical SAM protein [Candidatus Shapirobacteria bacterium]